MSFPKSFLTWVRSSLLGHITLFVLFFPFVLAVFSILFYVDGTLTISWFFRTAALCILCTVFVGALSRFLFTSPLLHSQKRDRRA